jgi:hypothetical protein
MVLFGLAFGCFGLSRCVGEREFSLSFLLDHIRRQAAHHISDPRRAPLRPYAMMTVVRP